MYDIALRKRALELVQGGLSLNAVSNLLGVSRAAIRDWLADPERALTRAVSGPGDCPRCRGEELARPSGYAYLLGQYLGDGCVSALRKGVFSLRIACADAWPGVMDEVESAMRSVAPTHKTYRVGSQGCTYVMAMWKHWPCLFPQHGPGRKHERPIVLADWQQAIVDAHPQEFLRGLFHSDGCRITNWTEKTAAGQRKRYEYGRYFFTNASTDILRLCSDTLDSLGVPWRMTDERNLSVARREGVAILDRFIGPKH
jgi:hypothetical protein